MNVSRIPMIVREKHNKSIEKKRSKHFTEREIHIAHKHMEKNFNLIKKESYS
jgi:hypothetical protein